MIKILTTLTIGLMAFGLSYGQESGSITVGGDIDKFYPVSWYDGGSTNNLPVGLTIARTNVHENSQWRGSLLASFEFHANLWGHSSEYINAHISGNLASGNIVHNNFIAGWADASIGNSSRRIIIWLRGGETTYHYNSDANVSPRVHDGIQYTVPFITTNGWTYDVKTAIEDYAIPTGTVLQKPLLIRSGNSSFMGNLGIGTTTPDSKLSVNGNIRAKEIKLETSNWPDYVFEEGYQQMRLEEVETFISEHGHLPGLKSAKEYEDDGVNMMELNQKLLEKVEELTLYAIEHKGKMDQDSIRIAVLERGLLNQQKAFENLLEEFRELKIRMD